MKEQMEELYKYYFFRRRFYTDSVSEEAEYEVGKADGALEAISALYLDKFGGKAMMNLWLKTLNEADNKDVVNGEE